MKWIVFGVVSLLWIAVCWFFGSMVALTDSGPAQSIAQQECAQRLWRQSGGAGDFQDLRYSDECMTRGRAVAREAAAPAQRKGLLIGIAPVLVAGVWLGRSRRRASAG